MVRCGSGQETGSKKASGASNGKSFAVIRNGQVFTMPEMWCEACHAEMLGVRHRGDCKETARREKAIQRLTDAGIEAERLLRRYQKLVIGGSPVYKEISIAIAELKRSIKRVGANPAR
jgi:hypothetical protein